MTILTRQERERLVLDLYYNQGKTYREISKEATMSPRDIGVILKKGNEEKNMIIIIMLKEPTRTGTTTAISFHSSIQ